jgi:hypothetical protein
MSFVTRLERALDERSRGRTDTVVVNRNDLRDLLHHFKRLDDDARAAYQKTRVVDYEHNDTRLEIHRAAHSIANNKVRPERLAYKDPT